MGNPRIHGSAPFRVAVIHGGPGAGGEMAPVARELAKRRGVLEPIQTATTLAGQIAELKRQLDAHADLPAILVGYSWGAWLSALLASEFPAMVARLILVASGPFDAAFVPALQAARMSRLSETERAEFENSLRILGCEIDGDRDAALARLGELSGKTDAFEALADDAFTDGDDFADDVRGNGEIFAGVWHEAAEMRQRGDLLRRAANISCEVIAIHGSHDPHPADGVEAPLSAVLARFRMIRLARCGHTPWRERHARVPFFAALESLL